VTERPIIFSGPMVRAILDGRKTQTRRVVKPQPAYPDSFVDMEPRSVGGEAHWFVHGASEPAVIWSCPFGAPGDRLWVRETLRQAKSGEWQYDADRKPVLVAPDDETAMIVWAHHNERDYCPSIHMPRWASRITLEITGVRVERLQEISEADAQAEGALLCDEVTGRVSLDDRRGSYRLGFNAIWSTIHAEDGPQGWAANPWVWALEFKRLEATV